MEQLFPTNPGTPFAVAAGAAAWIFEKGPIANGHLFNALMRIETTGPLWVTVYAYTAKSLINGTATCFPYPNTAAQFRGQASAYMLGGSFTVPYTQLTSGVWAHTHNCLTSTELLPITDNCSGQTFSCSRSHPQNNLGNWGLQYIYNVSVDNRGNSNPVTIDLLAGSGNLAGANVVINYGGTVSGGCIIGENAWRFLTDTVPANTKVDYNFQFINCSNSATPLYIGVKQH